MNLRLKFAILFASLVTIILLISSLVTWWLFSENRVEDFRARLKAEALLTFYNHFDRPSVALLPADVRSHLPGALPNMKTYILDDNYGLLYTNDTVRRFRYQYEELSRIKQHGTFYFSRGQTEAVGVYREKNGRRALVIVAAFDKYGRRKVANLQVILTLVLIGSILLSAGFSYYYLRELAKPFRKINQQIMLMSAQNLQQRLEVPHHYDELERFGENFNAMLDRLEKSFEIQKSFVHHASHELRTPLAVMLAQTESALRRELTVEEARRVLLSLREDQQEMVDLTNALLLLSQYEKISQVENWPLLRLDEMVYENIARIKELFPEMNVSLEFTRLPEDENDLSVKGNEVLLRSAIRNLFKNAYNYSSDKQLAITIELTDGHILLHFDNRGRQLTPEEQERLFLPFFRGENAQQKKGFGLGLTIVQRILAVHRGSVRYAAIGNDINRFTLVLPKGGPAPAGV